MSTFCIKHVKMQCHLLASWGDKGMNPISIRSFIVVLGTSSIVEWDGNTFFNIGGTSIFSCIKPEFTVTRLYNGTFIQITGIDIVCSVVSDRHSQCLASTNKICVLIKPCVLLVWIGVVDTQTNGFSKTNLLVIHLNVIRNDRIHEGNMNCFQTVGVHRIIQLNRTLPVITCTITIVETHSQTVGVYQVVQISLGRVYFYLVPLVFII